MSNESHLSFRVETIENNGKKKIPVWYIDEYVMIRVSKPKRKMKLYELYPQRLILEEARSLRKNANDFIDHDYYERELEKTPERYARMLEKYGVGINKIKQNGGAGG